MSITPTLDVRHIRQHVGSRSYQLGAQYAEDGAIFDATRLGHVIKARCHGSSGGPYRVRATIDGAAIREAHCSCPVGDDGQCKHVAAMLLVLLRHPDQFAQMEALDDALQRRSKEELIALIRHMIRRKPELESLLSLQLPTGQAKGRAEPVSSKEYRKQAASIIRAAQRLEWIDFHELQQQLDAIREIGDEFAQCEDASSAAAVYEGLLDELLMHEWLIHDDHDGHLFYIIDECVRGLGQCLQRAKDDAKLREAALRELFRVWTCDINAGGINLGPDAEESLLEHTTPEELQMIATWARQALARVGRGDGWAREAYGSLLAKLEADTLDDEGFLRLCRETGRVIDLVQRLLALGRMQEAIDEAERGDDWRLLEIAKLFVAAGHGDVAEGFVRKRSRTSKDVRLIEWLQGFCATDGRDLPAALKLGEELFRHRPSLHAYLRVRDAAVPLGAWEQIRQDLLKWLAKQGADDEIVRIHLHEGDVLGAVEALGHVKSSWNREALESTVAQAAEQELPRPALKIYQRQVERLLLNRQRGAYQEACKLLKHMRDLYGRLKQSKEWDKYIHGLREQNPKLRALHEELAAARLINA